MRPIILEASQEIGGISRTIRYKGNRMDIGGHRFFSKSDRVMQWWLELMPPAPDPDVPDTVEITYQGKRHKVEVPRRHATKSLRCAAWAHWLKTPSSTEDEIEEEHGHPRPPSKPPPHPRLPIT